MKEPGMRSALTHFLKLVSDIFADPPMNHIPFHTPYLLVVQPPINRQSLWALSQLQIMKPWNRNYRLAEKGHGNVEFPEKIRMQVVKVIMTTMITFQPLVLLALNAGVYHLVSLLIALLPGIRLNPPHQMPRNAYLVTNEQILS